MKVHFIQRTWNISLCLTSTVSTVWILLPSAEIGAGRVCVTNLSVEDLPELPDHLTSGTLVQKWLLVRECWDSGPVSETETKRMRRAIQKQVCITRQHRAAGRERSLAMLPVSNFSFPKVTFIPLSPRHWRAGSSNTLKQELANWLAGWMPVSANKGVLE